MNSRLPVEALVQHPRELVQVNRVALARLCRLDYGVDLGRRKIETLTEHRFQLRRFFGRLLAIRLCAVREQSRTRNLDLAGIELLVLAFAQNAIEEDFDLAKHGPVQNYAFGYAERTLLKKQMSVTAAP